MSIDVADLVVKLRADASGVKAGVNEANSEFTRLRGAALTLGPAFKQAADAMRAGLNSVNSEFARSNKGTSLLADAFKDLGIKSQAALNETARRAQESFRIISKAGSVSARDIQAAYEASAKATREALRGTAVEADKVADKSRSAFAGLGASLQQVGQGMAVAGAAMTAAITAPVAAVVTLGIEFNAMKERAITSFTSVLGSAEKAVGFFEELADFAARTPFELPGLVTSAQRFAALGIEAKAIIPILTAIGDTAAKFGKGAEGVDRITNALVQMVNKGKVSSEELTQQLGEIFPAVQILADKMGISTSALFDQMQKGAVKSSQAVKLLLVGMLERFGGEMEKQSATFSGLMSTLRDEARFAAGAITESLFNQLKGGLAALVEIIPRVTAVLRALPPEILAVGFAIAGVTAIIGPLLIVLGGLIALLGGPVTLAIVGVVGWVGVLTAAFALNFSRISEMASAWFGDINIQFTGVGRALGTLTDIFIVATRGIISSFDVLISGSIITAKAVISTFTDMAGVLANILTAVLSGNIVGIATAITAGVGAVGDAVGGELKALYGRLQSDTVAIGESWRGKYREAFGKAFAGASEATTKFKADYDAFLNDITTAFDKMGDKAGDAGKTAGKKAKQGFEQLNDETKKVLQEWLQTQQRGLDLSKELWNSLSPTLQRAAANYASAVQLINHVIQRELFKGLVEKINQQKPVLEIAAQDWAKYKDVIVKAGVSVEDALRKLGVAVKLIFPDISRIIVDHSSVVKSSLDAVIERGIQPFFEELTKGFEAVTAAAPHWAGAIVEAATKIESAIESAASVIQARAEQDIRSAVEGVVELFVRLGEQAGKTGAELVEFVQGKLRTLPKEVQEAAEGTVKVWAGELVKLPGIWDSVFDGILQRTGDFGTAAGARIKGLFGEMFGLLGELPGKWGDALNRTTREIERWISFLDKALKLVQRLLGDDSPGGLGDLLSGAVGIFKKATSQLKQTAQDATNDWAGSLLNMVTGTNDSMGKVGETAKKAASKFNATIGTMTGALAGFTTGAAAAASGMSTAASAISGALSGALSGFAAGGPIGAIVGGVAGIFGGLFGKSAHQKRMERLAEERAAAEIGVLKEGIKKAMQETVQAAIQTMQDALKLFDELPGFAEIPKGLIKAFFKNLSQLLNLFVELAGQWSKDMLDKVKAFSETIGPVITTIGAGVQSFEALAGFLGTPQRAVDAFARALEAIINALGGILDSIEKRALKQARRIATKVAEIVEVVGAGVEAFAGLFSFGRVSHTAVENFAASIRDTAVIFGRTVSEIDGFMLKQAAKAAERLAAIVGLLRDGTTAFSDIRAFKRVPAESLHEFFQGVREAADEMIVVADTIDTEMLSQAAAVAEKIGAVIGLISGAVNAFKDIAIYAGVPSSTMQLLADDITKAVTALAQASLSLSDEVVGTAVTFASRVAETVEVIGKAISALGGLSTYTGAAYASVGAFGADLRETIRLFADLASQFTTEMLSQSAAFAESLSKSLEAIKTAIDVLKGLEGFQGVPGQIINAFFASMTAVVARMRELGGLMGDEVLDRAIAFADRSRAVFAAIRDGVSAFNSLDTLREIGTEEIERFLTNFTRLADAIAEMALRATAIKSDAETVRDALVTAASSISTGLAAATGAMGLRMTLSPDAGERSYADPGVLVPRSYASVLESSSSSTSSTTVDKSLTIGTLTLPGGPATDAAIEALKRILPGAERASYSY